MKKIILAFQLILFCSSTWSHEQWLLSAQEMEELSTMPSPVLFTNFTFFSLMLVILAFLGILIWILITFRIPLSIKRTGIQIAWATICLRFCTGLMLIFSSLGLLPKSYIPFFIEPTLFAPNLLIDALPAFWQFLQWIELGLGLWLFIGIFLRWAAIVLLILVFLSLYLYGLPMIHYSGFYLGIGLFLLINCNNSLSFMLPHIPKFNSLSLFLMQFLTGVNFIYSALYVKYLTPNVDIFLLKKNQAFTFGFPYDKFVLIMLIVEIIFGLLFILGRKLRIISIFLLGLFIFTSINLSENLLAHSFIYGILSVFIILDGQDIMILSRKNSHSTH